MNSAFSRAASTITSSQKDDLLYEILKDVHEDALVNIADAHPGHRASRGAILAGFRLRQTKSYARLPELRTKAGLRHGQRPENDARGMPESPRARLEKRTPLGRVRVPVRARLPSPPSLPA
jgi:hypothetical protein